MRDTNRNWNTLLTDPAQDHGIDTVIIHKNAMNVDIPALGHGAVPYALLDFHQNFGDEAPNLDYVLYTANTVSSQYMTRLQSLISIASGTPTPPSASELRGYWSGRGVQMTLCL